MIDFSTACRRKIISAGLLVAFLAGCASVPASPEAAVRERAKQRWQALMSGNIEKAYEMNTPAYRAVTSLDRYRAEFGGPVRWEAAEVTLVTCEAEKCTARVRIDAKTSLRGRLGGSITTYVDETWLSQQGQWWIYSTL